MCNNIAEIYTHLGDDENAFKYLQHALDIRLKGTVSTHTDIAAIYNNLGHIYQRRNEFKKALEIDTQTFDDNHKSLALSHNNIGNIYQQINDLSKALYHIEIGLKVLLRSQARDNASLLAK